MGPNFRLFGENSILNGQFFIGLRLIASPAMLEDTVFASEEYRRWGYFGRENLSNKKAALKLSPNTRQQILEVLLRNHARIRITDYWNAIGRSVSKRQSERDLQNHPGLRAHGRTKARYFTKRALESGTVY